MEHTNVISLNSIVVRNDEKFMTSPVGDEIVMMSIESGNYIGINKVGADIWQKLENPISVGDLVNYLLENYDIAKEDCEQKTIKYLCDMLKEDMLIIIN